VPKAAEPDVRSRNTTGELIFLATTRRATREQALSEAGRPVPKTVGAQD